MRADHDIRVEIPGFRPSGVHTLNSETLAMIWDVICRVPMSRFEYWQLERRLTGPCARRDAIRDLAENPVVVIPVGDREVRIRWANSPTGEPL
ncbi:hypothetical protein ACFU6K_11220 [Kitasatospora sp. NPDC057512]|uniref:hypothetical protein n=1 Tax=Kitasatospora sp. NPDC057512 TaxID=3346154 RepID=UPI0036C2AE9C